MARHKAPYKLESNALGMKKALEFVGDNSAYQKAAVLLCVVPLFVLTSQLAYLSVRVDSANTIYQFFFFASLGILTLPRLAETHGRFKALLGGVCLHLLGSVLLLDLFLTNVLPFLGSLGIALCAFSKGLLVVVYIYIAEISGDSVRAWLPIWTGVAMAVAVPFTGLLGVAAPLLCVPLLAVDLYYIRFRLKESPRFLTEQRQEFEKAKAVLGYMARFNDRPDFAFRL
jgi:MFS family permease